jgi:hypothetical protein
MSLSVKAPQPPRRPALLALFRQKIRGTWAIAVAACLLLLAHPAAADDYQIEAGYQGAVKQLAETKTPYNTVLVDAQGKPVFMSFDEGEYAGQLNVETTALNNLFVVPRMIVSKNKAEIVRAIQANSKFPRMLDYYRQYLATGNSVKLDFYLKLRDSLLLDLAERDHRQKLF